MKYITSVKDNGNTKHIVEVSGKNIEVVEESSTPERYGNMTGCIPFTCNNVKVFPDLTFKCNSGSDSVHLAQVVFAIEVVRFIIGETSL